jgi:hypothetical protein
MLFAPVYEAVKQAFLFFIVTNHSLITVRCRFP